MGNNIISQCKNTKLGGLQVFNFTKKRQIVILILGISLFVFLKVYSYDSAGDDEASRLSTSDYREIESLDKEIELEDKEEDGADLEKADDIMVHIKGAVNFPGIIKTELGARVVEIVDKAGGFTEEADLESVNLARKVEDEEMIYIPRIGEDPSRDETTEAGLDKRGESQGQTKSGKININKASKEELKTLSGIGDVTAEKIMQYREEQKFDAIEDIMNVSGIGQKKFEAIEEFIVVK